MFELDSKVQANWALSILLLSQIEIPFYSIVSWSSLPWVFFRLPLRLVAGFRIQFKTHSNSEHCILHCKIYKCKWLKSICIPFSVEVLCSDWGSSTFRISSVEVYFCSTGPFKCLSIMGASGVHSAEWFLSLVRLFWEWLKGTKLRCKISLILVFAIGMALWIFPVIRFLSFRVSMISFIWWGYRQQMFIWESVYGYVSNWQEQLREEVLVIEGL
jgi:hypothetical protein